MIAIWRTGRFLPLREVRFLLCLVGMIKVSMGKRSVGKKCVYCCSAPCTTEDHIFARQFFLVANRDNLPKAPACGRCNGRKSHLEHYLTSVLPFGGHHNAATDTVMESVTRRFPKNQKLSREFMRTLRPAWVEEALGLSSPRRVSSSIALSWPCCSR
jgi:hypothetical protein